MHLIRIIPAEGGIMSYFIERAEDGSYYSLTKAGTVSVIAVIILLILIVSLISGKEKKRFSVKRLVFTAMALAVGYILSNIRIVKLPWGGSATLCSMFFVTIIGYWYGAGTGLIAGFAYGLLQFIQGGGSYILDPFQAGLDYFLAFAALGVSGFFQKGKHRLVAGYSVAIFCRAALHSLGGYLYWMDYMPENFPAGLAAVYPIVYNYAYILIEGVITVVLLELSPVRKAVERISRMAQEEGQPVMAQRGRLAKKRNYVD